MVHTVLQTEPKGRGRELLAPALWAALGPQKEVTKA